MQCTRSFSTHQNPLKISKKAKGCHTIPRVSLLQNYLPTPIASVHMCYGRSKLKHNYLKGNQILTGVSRAKTLEGCLEGWAVCRTHGIWLHFSQLAVGKKESKREMTRPLVFLFCFLFCRVPTRILLYAYATNGIALDCKVPQAQLVSFVCANPQKSNVWHSVSAGYLRRSRICLLAQSGAAIRSLDAAALHRHRIRTSDSARSVQKRSTVVWRPLQ